MHAILFEGTSEEANHPTGISGIDLYGGQELNQLAPGDVLWLVTRLGTDRAAPALCGRVVVDRIAQHRPAVTRYRGDRADRTHCVLGRKDLSERCRPFACSTISSWDVWRRNFAGLQSLTDEQGRTLEAEWKRTPRIPAPQ